MTGGAPNTINRAGFKRFVTKDGSVIKTQTDFHKSFGEKIHADEVDNVDIEYFLLTEPFKTEVCKGYDHRKVTKFYVDLGVIIPSEVKGKVSSPTCSVRLPSLGRVQCYKISKDFMSLTQ